MAAEDATPGRTRSGGRSTRRAVIATGVLAFVSPITLGLVAQRLDSEQWKWDDWAAVVSAVLLGSLFFVLALIVGSDGARRARAVADAELMTSIGGLHMSSARSFAGSDQQALRIAASARAALQHFANAGAAEQQSLIKTIEDAYSDLVFGTFSRPDVGPRPASGGPEIPRLAGVLARRRGGAGDVGAAAIQARAGGAAPWADLTGRSCGASSWTRISQGDQGCYRPAHVVVRSGPCRQTCQRVGPHPARGSYRQNRPVRTPRRADAPLLVVLSSRCGRWWRADCG